MRKNKCFFDLFCSLKKTNKKKPHLQLTKRENKNTLDWFEYERDNYGSMIAHTIVIKIILIFSCFSLQPPLKYALFLLSNDMLSKRNLNKKRAPQTSDRKKKDENVP